MVDRPCTRHYSTWEPSGSSRPVKVIQGSLWMIPSWLAIQKLLFIKPQ